jgi:hypothetical protein
MNTMDKKPPAPKKSLAVRRKSDATTVKPTTEQHKRPRAEVLGDLCQHLSTGETLEEACRRVPDAPHPATVLKWVEKDPEGLGQVYAQARARGYLLLGDRIDELSRQTTAVTQFHALCPEGRPMYNPDGTPVLKDVVVSLSADVMASKRLQVDTLKWKLSKMLPKIYGDKIVNEHTGKDGGPIALAAVDLKNLSDDELAQMQALMGKVATGGAK